MGKLQLKAAWRAERTHFALAALVPIDAGAGRRPAPRRTQDVEARIRKMTPTVVAARSVAVLILFASPFLIASCSRDPHTITINGDHRETFSTLVTAGNGLTPVEFALLKDAELRIKKNQAANKVVGKTIGEVIKDQQTWQSERQQLLERLDGVYRSLKAIQGATSVGVNFAKYGELLQGAATELNVVNDKPLAEEEGRVVGLFQAAFQSYRDAGTFWQYQISKARNEDLYGGQVGYTLTNSKPNPEIKALVDKYNLTIHDGHDGFGKYQFLTKDSTQGIWLVADSTLGTAVDTYFSK